MIMSHLQEQFCKQRNATDVSRKNFINVSFIWFYYVKHSSFHMLRLCALCEKKNLLRKMTFIARPGNFSPDFENRIYSPLSLPLLKRLMTCGHVTSGIRQLHFLYLK